MKSIYLDNNSTTFLDARVIQQLHRCRESQFANPASQHQLGQRARRELERLRSEILTMAGGRAGGRSDDQLILTSGGTESNQLAMFGLAYEPDGTLPACRRILVSAIEHPSVTAAAEVLKSRGFEVEFIACDELGQVDLESLNGLLQQPTRLVSVMLANNETGVLAPIPEIALRCHQHGALLHTDAVQAIGKIGVSFEELDADAMTFTAHKFHGPRGIGALVLKHNVQPYPIMFGGFQQRAIRPGTEDVCLTSGFHAALQLCVSDRADRTSRMTAMRDELQRRLMDSGLPIVVNGGQAIRVPQTLNVSFLGVDRQAFLLAADMNGLAISTGSACASGSSEPSPVLLAMGLPAEVVESAIRISLSAFTTLEEIELAGERLLQIASDLLNCQR